MKKGCYKCGGKIHNQGGTASNVEGMSQEQQMLMMIASTLQKNIKEEGQEKGVQLTLQMLAKQGLIDASTEEGMKQGISLLEAAVNHVSTSHGDKQVSEQGLPEYDYGGDDEMANGGQFEPHMMYKDGRSALARTYQEHLDLADAGYNHEEEMRYGGRKLRKAQDGRMIPEDQRPVPVEGPMTEDEAFIRDLWDNRSIYPTPNTMPPISFPPSYPYDDKGNRKLPIPGESTGEYDPSKQCTNCWIPYEGEDRELVNYEDIANQNEVVRERVYSPGKKTFWDKILRPNQPVPGRWSYNEYDPQELTDEQIKSINEREDARWVYQDEDARIGPGERYELDEESGKHEIKSKELGDLQSYNFSHGGSLPKAEQGYHDMYGRSMGVQKANPLAWADTFAGMVPQRGPLGFAANIAQNLIGMGSRVGNTIKGVGNMVDKFSSMNPDATGDGLDKSERKNRGENWWKGKLWNPQDWDIFNREQGGEWNPFEDNRRKVRASIHMPLYQIAGTVSGSGDPLLSFQEWIAEDKKRGADPNAQSKYNEYKKKWEEDQGSPVAPTPKPTIPMVNAPNTPQANVTEEDEEDDSQKNSWMQGLGTDTTGIGGPMNALQGVKNFTDWWSHFKEGPKLEAEERRKGNTMYAVKPSNPYNPFAGINYDEFGNQTYGGRDRGYALGAWQGSQGLSTDASAKHGGEKYEIGGEYDVDDETLAWLKENGYEYETY